MKVCAIVNTNAGSVGLDGSHRMERTLASIGIEHPQVLQFEPGQSAEQINALIKHDPDLLIVWGGDGTHRTALRAAGNAFNKILLLPGGTMNLLTKWIHGHHQWDRILRSVIAQPTHRILPAGVANDEPFYCALLAGVPARLAEAREDLRAGNIGKALHDMGVAVESTHRLHLAARTGTTDDHLDGLPEGNVIAALVGPMAHGNRMEVAGLNLPTAVAALNFAWSSMRSDWRSLEGMQIREAETLMVSDDDGQTIPVIADGEHIDLGSSFIVRFHQAAATCLVATK